MKVALTYFLAGSGHFREAYSIAKSLQKQGHQTNLIDIESQLVKSHKLSAKICLWYYHLQMFLFLAFGEKTSIEDLDEKESTKTKFAKILISCFRKFEYWLGSLIKEDLDLAGYDVVISTHPIASVLAVGAGFPEVINICPDEIGEVTSSFFKVDEVLTGVNSERVLKIFEKLEFKGEIKVVGHPLDPDVLSRRQEVFDRVQKNLEKGNLCLGVFAGWITPNSQKSEMLAVAKELAQILLTENISVKFLVGNHQDLENRIKQIFIGDEFKDRVEIVATEDVNELVRVGHRLLIEEVDILFSRPSELVFYSLSLGMPHILFSGVGPGEEDMLRFLQKFAPVKPYIEAEGYLQQYLHNKQNLIDMSIDLFGSGYNFEGSKNIASLLKD